MPFSSLAPSSVEHFKFWYLYGVMRSQEFSCKGKVVYDISSNWQCRAKLFLLVQCWLQMWFHCRLPAEGEKKNCFDAVKLQGLNPVLEKTGSSGK